MAKKAPWHSDKQSIHHNNTGCNTGNDIDKENLQQGTAGKPLCKQCARLAGRHLAGTRTSATPDDVNPAYIRDPFR